MTKRDRQLIIDLRATCAKERERRIEIENKMEDLRDFLIWLLQDVFEFKRED